MRSRLIPVHLVPGWADAGSVTVNVLPAPGRLVTDGPAVAFGDPFRERQSEAGALGLARTGRDRPDRIARRDAAARQARPVPVSWTSRRPVPSRTANVTDDAAALGREFDRVVEQDQQQPLQPACVADHDHAVGRLARQRDALRLGDRLDLVDDRCGERAPDRPAARAIGISPASARASVRI